ncbi:hypothetical protein BN946_scf184757.g1 [Trametes cinnabarina]|uniref:Protein kinase domain-containing protein n=1 Tax=Pycnoporus cinnabarinus TaxID=5643 RepID=A0A060SLI4_PYCCI|nr:hypothetical protein BN946_scf184757.g1 [Trametes cinnabarina]
MYGCYAGDTDDGRTAILVLQYCGTPLKYKLRGYALELRTQVVRAVLAVHKAGLAHNDVHEHNILVSKDVQGEPQIVLIDFNLATNHFCTQQVDDIATYNCIPNSYTCTELEVVFKELAELVLPDSVKIFDKIVPLEMVTSASTVLEYTGIPESVDKLTTFEIAEDMLDASVGVHYRRLAQDAVPVLIEWDSDSGEDE